MAAAPQNVVIAELRLPDGTATDLLSTDGLSMNSFDAMRSSGGVLQVDVDICEQPDINRDSTVRITVTDTGRGIDQRSLDRIFEPFSTTKPKGEGLGLGLSVVREIVKARSGDIKVESEPGKGSVFQVQFPCYGTVGGSTDGTDFSPPGRASVVL